MTTTSVCDEMNSFMDTASERSSLDILELGGQLSQLSRAKEAVALNSVHHVRMCMAYDREEHVTVYVLDVFLQAVPRGLPKMSATAAAVNMHKQSKRERRRQAMREKDELHADYQVEHRYSAFRMLRERIRETVATPKSTAHPQWCPYCSRVRELVNSSGFPIRFPNRGRVASVTGLHKLLVRSREQHLETFVNRLLNAAKDVSYRSGCNPCGHFEAVSRLLSDFLMNIHLCASEARGDKEGSAMKARHESAIGKDSFREELNSVSDRFVGCLKEVTIKRKFVLRQCTTYEEETSEKEPLQLVRSYLCRMQYITLT